MNVRHQNGSQGLGSISFYSKSGKRLANLVGQGSINSNYSPLDGSIPDISLFEGDEASYVVHPQKENLTQGRFVVPEQQPELQLEHLQAKDDQ